MEYTPNFANAWLAILSAVVGLVGFYLRYYTKSAIGDAVREITDRMDERIGRLRDDLHIVDAKLSRLEGRVSERRGDDR